MVLMAIDHASFFIARVHPAETWASGPPYYASTIAFLTRWVTHLCAPGFFLLMGAGYGDVRGVAACRPGGAARG